MSNKHGKLTEEQKEYVVRRLAASDRPAAVRKGLMEEFGVKITGQSVRFYDPTKRASAKRPGRWKPLFDAARQEVRNGGAEIGAPCTENSGKLTAAQKEYVVHRLAAFDSPSTVQKALLEQFGVKITRSSIEFYDPTKRASAKRPEKWQEIFFATRKAFVEGRAEIGASHPLVRIRWRETMALRQMERENDRLANDILDSIAEEVGDRNGNRLRHVSGANGVPQVATIYINGMPESEFEAVAFESKATETPYGGAVGDGKSLTRCTNS